MHHCKQNIMKIIDTKGLIFAVATNYIEYTLVKRIPSNTKATIPTVEIDYTQTS